MTTSLLTQGAASARRHPVGGPPPDTRLKAFPTAEGFGALSVGGRGPGGITPQIIRVTNLADTGAGSLRTALTAAGPRFIVFDVAGTIELASPLELTQPYAYVAGQTAPHRGICVRGTATLTQELLRVRTHNLVFRHLRFRQGFVGDQYPNPTPGSAGQAARDVVHFVGTENVIWDQCSFSWSTDGLFETHKTTRYFTTQWCIFAEPLHSAGHEITPGHGRPLNHSYDEDTEGIDTHKYITDHHNLLAHSDFRTPQIATGVGKVECINNVIYHSLRQGAVYVNAFPNEDITSPKLRYVANYGKRLNRGSDGQTHLMVCLSAERGPLTKIYVNGNLGEGTRVGRTSVAQPEWDCVTPNARSVAMGGTATDDPITVTDPLCTQTDGTTFDWPQIRVTEHTAAQAYALIANTATPRVGATKPMIDEVDLRIIQRTIDGTGPIPGSPNALLDHPGQLVTPNDFTHWAGYPVLTIGGSPALWTAPADPMDVASNGYLNIENALNALAGDAIP